MPADGVFDGELVALGEDGWPYFPAVCESRTATNASGRG
jgi:hypothetical protein